MLERLKKLLKTALCHHSIYGGLTGCHAWAAWSTGKPEVYLPMVALYLILSITG